MDNITPVKAAGIGAKAAIVLLLVGFGLLIILGNGGG